MQVELDVLIEVGGEFMESKESFLNGHIVGRCKLFENCKEARHDLFVQV